MIIESFDLCSFQESSWGASAFLIRGIVEWSNEMHERSFFTQGQAIRDDALMTILLIEMVVDME